MDTRTRLLDCTLRDGAYIVDSRFGSTAMRGIINKMQSANVDIIECGWLKNTPHEIGSTFFHVPSDVKQYLVSKSEHVTYVVMIDWDRYDLDNLPENDGQSIDAIRVVFPYEKYREGMEVGNKIKEKGYQVFFQAANTLAYNDDDLVQLAEEANRVHPVSLSVVDTFGAMYNEDLERIVSVLDKHLDKDIKLGFHSHNNQQLSFSLTMRFVELLEKAGREAIVDSSLCGMGRGAGNATTELVANYLNRKQHGNYDMNAIMDAIDMYMEYFQENYTWGYSTQYFIAGMYCCHVNNIAYLMKNHRTTAKDMRNIIASLSNEERKKYDYDLLEEKYLENQNRIVEDEDVLAKLKEEFAEREILLIAPGKSVCLEEDTVKKYIQEKNPIVIGVNAIIPTYEYDYLFIMNPARYFYAKETYTEQFERTKKILLSNIKTVPGENEMIVNFNRVIKRGWKYFDNAVINCLRLMEQMRIRNIAIAGFDGFKHKYNESYADISLPSLNPDNDWDGLNREIKDMLSDFKTSMNYDATLRFVTASEFDDAD